MKVKPSAEYHRYKVVKKFEVEAGEIAPAFEQPGGGIQYVTKVSIEELKKIWLFNRIVIYGDYKKRLFVF
jgi:hypothetical protein